MIVGAAALAVLIDFTGRLLSFLADGALMAVLVVGVIVLRRGWQRENAMLRAENARLRVTGGLT